MISKVFVSDFLTHGGTLAWFSGRRLELIELQAGFAQPPGHKIPGCA